MKSCRVYDVLCQGHWMKVREGGRKREGCPGSLTRGHVSRAIIEVIGMRH